MIEPTGGEIVIDGENVTAMSEKQLIDFRRNKIAMVFQHYGLMPHRNVLDNASWGLEIQGVGQDERYARAGEILDMVGSGGIGRCPSLASSPAGCNNGWGWPAP